MYCVEQVKTAKRGKEMALEERKKAVEARDKIAAEMRMNEAESRAALRAKNAEMDEVNFKL